MTHYRLAGHDYRRGFHFITISTEPRRDILSRIENGQITLTHIGEIVLRALEETLAKYPDLHLRVWMIMPNHVHFVFEHIKPLPMHLGHIIGYFKARVTRYISCETILPNPQIFEKNYYDIVALDGEQLDHFVRYVQMNPIRWQWKKDNKEYCTKYYGLQHERLPQNVRWTALGDRSLLDWPRLTPVIVSRQVKTYEFDAISEKYLMLLNEGYTLVSGFISPGEKAVFDVLSRQPNARIIALLPYGMANYKAHGNTIDRLKNGRTLVLSGFSEDVPTTPIHRENCLKNNLWIQQICASQRLACRSATPPPVAPQTAAATTSPPTDDSFPYDNRRGLGD